MFPKLENNATANDGGMPCWNVYIWKSRKRYKKSELFSFMTCGNTNGAFSVTLETYSHRH